MPFSQGHQHGNTVPILKMIPSRLNPKSIPFRAMALSATLSLFACKPSEKTSGTAPVTDVTTATSGLEKPSRAPGVPAVTQHAPTPPVAEKPPAYDPTSVQLTASQRQAAQWRLLGKMLAENDPAMLSATSADFAVSPAALVNALQALWWGTRGETAEEFDPLFKAQPTSSSVAESSGAAGGPGGLGGSVTLRSASSLWVDDKFLLNPAYTKLLKERGLGQVETVNWSDMGAALAKLNRWAEEATEGRIKEAMASGALRPPVAFVLCSVVGFKGAWASGFDPEATRTEDFKLLDGSARPAAFMKATRNWRHAAIENGPTLLEMPFSDNRHRLIIVLPEEAGAKALGKVESELAKSAPAWLAKLAPSTLSVSLPRFSVAGEAEPRRALEALGVRRIFSDKEADFSGASDVAGLKLDVIKHQAQVRIDEAGAEAVATTVASVAAKSFEASASEFRADRPFAFLLLGEGDELLFAGRVATPSAPSDTVPPQNQPEIRSGLNPAAQ